MAGNRQTELSDPQHNPWTQSVIERQYCGTTAYCDRFAGYSLFVSRDNPFPITSLQCASAIGVELQAGVIVNRELEQMLTLPETRESFAQAIATGIVSCLTRRTDAR